MPAGDPPTPGRADPAKATGDGEPGPEQRAGRSGRAHSGLATACLIAGIAGITLVTIVPALVCGVLGLRRAGRAGLRGPRSGRVRCWAGIGLAVIWAATGVYLLPRPRRPSGRWRLW
jgi:hypothetical protein